MQRHDEPTHADIPEDDDEPASKGFVRQEIAELKTFIREENEETRRHFDVVVETIEDTMAGAHADEVSLLKDKQHDHEQRIGALEQAR